MYSKGLGVSQNYSDAVKWYRMAAEVGNDAAQANLGLRYANGDGVPQDYVQALMWCILSGRAGAPIRQQLLPRMSSAQIAEAERLAKQWKPKK
jgi:TPR repeat protein